MMKQCLFLVFFILSGVLMAQSKISISGIVVDKAQVPIGQASVRILNAKDSSYVTGNATDVSGAFKFQLKKAKYIVKVSYMGYLDSYVNVNAEKADNQLGKIVVHEDGVLLKTAVVTAQAVEVKVSGDTVEYNANSYKTQPSAVLEDLLKKMPGTTVGDDGTITVNGKTITKILVDGKEFFSDDPKVASKNLPASIINKLQVLDKKSDLAQMTGFDDGNEETVINLTIKKGMKKGLFGNAFVGAGSHGRYEGNGMVSAMRDNSQYTLLAGTNNTNNAGFTDIASNSFGSRRPRGMNFGGNNGILTSTTGGFNFATQSSKLKWGGNLRLGDTNNDVEQKSHTQYLMSNQSEQQNSSGLNKSTNTNLGLRFEWSPDSATQIVFKPNIQYNTNKNWQNTDFLTSSATSGDSINWGNSKYSSTGSSTSLNGELEISRQLNKKGRVLSFEFGGGTSRTKMDAFNYSETDYNPTLLQRDSILNQKINQKDNSYNWSAEVSYVEPLSHNNFLQIQYSYANNHSVSDKDTYAADAQGNYTYLDPGYTKKLVNDFVNQSVGLNFKSVREKYNYSVGFALKPSSSLSTTYMVDSVVGYPRRNYINFSPSGRFNYMWSKTANLRVDYRGVTIQPTSAQLLTVPDNTDPLNTTVGNINLKPSFKNQLSIRFRDFSPQSQSMYALFGRFSLTNNDIVKSTTNNADGSRSNTYENANGTVNGNLRFMMSRPIAKINFGEALGTLSLNNMTYGAYSNTKSFITDTTLVRSMNQSQNIQLSERAGLKFTSDFFDLSVGGNLTFNDIRNSVSTFVGQKTYDFGAQTATTLYVSKIFGWENNVLSNFVIDTDLNYSTNYGYSAGYKLNQYLWNASVAKTFAFKRKDGSPTGSTGTIRFKMYDILHQKSNISRTSTTTSISDVTSNALGSYFMIHFIYKFQIFGGGAKASDMNFGGGHGHGGHGMY